MWIAPKLFSSFQFFPCSSYSISDVIYAFLVSIRLSCSFAFTCVFIFSRSSLPCTYASIFFFNAGWLSFAHYRWSAFCSKMMAVSFWQFIVSAVIICLSIYNVFNNSCTAGISLLFSSVLLCANVRLSSEICALMICRGPFILDIRFVEQMDFPSSKMVRFLTIHGQKWNDLIHEVLIECFRFDHLQHTKNPVIAGYMFNFKTLF